MSVAKYDLEIIKEKQEYFCSVQFYLTDSISGTLSFVYHTISQLTQDKAGIQAI